MNPITREESLLDGQDLTPITRKEKFIKRIYDKTQEVPTPVTREEWFLKKAGEGTSPVEVEELNVTANGTYSEEGKAYSPVIVEVPAPTLKTKTITENGTYNASEDNADGYSQVTVNVPYMEKKSASGDIASFSDGAGYPFLKVKANINPVQDLHGYDYPWVGGAGKNKCPDKAVSSSNAIIYIGQDDLDAFPFALTGGTAYTLSFVTSKNVSAVYLREENETAGTLIGTSSPTTFTATATGNYKIAIVASESITPNDFTNIQLEVGSSATAYSPYSNICPISGFTGVNVANVADKVQYFKGLLDGTYGFVDLGTLPWDVISGAYYARVPNKTYGIGNLTCAKYPTYTTTPTLADMPDKMIKGGSSNDNVYAKDSAYPTSTAFRTAMSGVHLIYELATPTTPTITPTQFNNLLAEFSIGGAVYPISWQNEAGIVYGGYIDLVSGVLTVTKAGIAEYNGETLPSAWISDRDRYVAGNTPTIGAQVVYDLATPQTYQLTPQQINTLIGQNNVWNEVNGQTEVEYFIPIE